MARMTREFGNFRGSTLERFSIEYEELPVCDDRPVYTVQEISDLVRPILEQFPCEEVFILQNYWWYLNPEGLMDFYVKMDPSKKGYLPELADVIDCATNIPAIAKLASENYDIPENLRIVIYRKKG